MSNVARAPQYNNTPRSQDDESTKPTHYVNCFLQLKDDKRMKVGAMPISSKNPAWENIIAFLSTEEGRARFVSKLTFDLQSATSNVSKDDISSMFASE